MSNRLPKGAGAEPALQVATSKRAQSDSVRDTCSMSAPLNNRLLAAHVRLASLQRVRLSVLMARRVS